MGLQASEVIDEVSLQPKVAPRGSIFHCASVFSISFAAAILFSALGPYTNFSSPGYLDPWIYTGYFTHYAYLIQHYGLTYYVSRLPWIIPGLMAFKVATPATASILLNALIVATSATALYFCVKPYYGIPPAVIACVALITNPYFMSSVAWDYPDGPAIAYLFVGLAFFLTSSKIRIPNCAIGGACLALALHTNLNSIPVIGGILAVPCWRWRSSWRQWLRRGIEVATGAAAITIVLAIIGKRLFGTFQFFKPQYMLIGYVREHPDYLPRAWGTGNGWIASAFRLSPLALLLVLGAILLLVRRKWNPIYAAGYVCLVATSAFLALFQFELDGIALRVAYCSSYMVAPVLVFAGLLLGEYLSRGSESGTAGLRKHIPLGIVALLGLVLPFVYGHYRPLHVSSGQAWAGIFIGAGLTAIALWTFQAKDVLTRAVTCSLILAILFLGPAYDNWTSYIWSKDNGAIFQLIMRIENVVDAGITPDRMVRFWYDRNEPGPSSLHFPPAHLFDSTYAVYVGGYYDFTQQLPSCPTADIQRLVSAKTTFVHITFAGDHVVERTRLLAACGIAAGNERHWTIPSSFGELSIVLQDVIDDSKLH